jgi:hypothetical protein
MGFYFLLFFLKKVKWDGLFGALLPPFPTKLFTSSPRKSLKIIILIFFEN